MRRTLKADCGCTLDAIRWLVPCAAHKAEVAAHHAQAATEHAAAMRARDPEYVSLRDTLADIAVAGAGGAP